MSGKIIENNRNLIEQLVNNVGNDNNLFNPENFVDQKLKNFCEFLLSKDLDEIKNNINALKFIHALGGLSLFVKNGLLPIKDKLDDPTPEIEEEILRIICPKDKVKDIITKFSKKEKEKIMKFMHFLIDSETNGLL